MPKRPRILERNIQDGIVTILSLDDWIITILDPGYRPGQVMPKDYVPGTADLIAVRPLNGPEHHSSWSHAKCDVMWIETKRPRGKVSETQRIWHESMRARGALTVIVGEDCEASSEAFRLWYESSSLCRRKLV